MSGRPTPESSSSFGVLIEPAASSTSPSARASVARDRKSTRLNSSHVKISYAVFRRARQPFPTRRSSDLLVDGADLQVILQVLADAGARMRHLDTESAQDVRAADAGKLQQLWRINRACGQQHFTIGARLGRA